MESSHESFSEQPEDNADTNKAPVSGIAVQNFSVPGSIIVAGIIIALAIVYSGGDFGGGAPVPTPVPQAGDQGAVVDQKTLYTDKDAALGDPSAPVTFIEFSDFQCPFCGKFFRETEGQLIDTYVKTGKVQFVYKHFAFLGQESQWAGEAAECAGDQGKFWEYHDFLFNHMWDTYYGQGKQGENVGALSKENLKKFGKQLGLDSGRFDACVDAGTHADKVSKDTALGRANGVSGTPSSFVNGKILVGAQPYSQFSTLIEEALKTK